MKRIILGVLLLVGFAAAQDDLSLDDLLAELFTPSPLNNNNNNIPARPTPVQPIQPAGNTNPTQQTPLNRPPVTGQPTAPLPTNNNFQCNGECVPYYLCSNNSVITDGAGLLDIRIDVQDEPRDCADYLEVCCSADNQLTEPDITPQPVQPTGCGYRHKEGVGFRISGDADNESEFGEFPWIVAVLKEERRAVETSANMYLCGGSLIHENVVLTAAHCVEGKEANKLKIRAGEWDTQTKNELYAHQDRGVSRVILHPNFSKSNLNNDIALLILREPVQFDAHISTVCLPPQDTNFDRSRCLAAGWGKDVFGKEGKYQVILKKIEMPMVPFNQCQKAFRSTRLGQRFQLSNSFVCAGGEPGKDTCKGDGGSPLVCPIVGRGNDRYYQSGIVAWGIGCGENNVPGAYVNVAKFRNWIDGEMRRLNFNTAAYTA